MTIEKLKKGQALLEQINGLKKQKENWEESTMFGDVYIRSKTEQRSLYFSADTSFIDFEFAKEQVLAKINDLINKLQKEFDEL